MRKMHLNTRGKLIAMRDMGKELMEKLKDMMLDANEKEKMEIRTFLEELSTLSEKLKEGMTTGTGWIFYLLRGNNFKEIYNAVEKIKVYMENFKEYHEHLKEQGKIFYEMLKKEIQSERVVVIGVVLQKLQ